PLPAGVRPIGSAPTGGAYVPPVGFGSPAAGGLAPAGGAPRPAPTPPRDTEIRSALGPNHPWAIKPEHGEYFLCVKSYSRPSQPEPGDKGLSARELAEALATDIRDLYRVQAFLYEYVSEERKAEMAAIAAARERARVFATQLEKYRQEAQLKGMIFLEDEAVRVRYKTVRYNDQIAVLVGGFKTEADARKALDTMRQWPAPKNTQLMDIAQVPQFTQDGKREIVGMPMNPYLTAHVVPNPMIERDGPKEAAGLDPFVKKLNEDNPYSLLKATKGWTLAVKSFSSPVEIQGQDGGNVGLMRKAAGSKAARVLEASGDQAEKMAAALRKLKGKGGEPLNLEAFVLHTRTASIVTVGQFDGPNDPALLQTKQLLTSLPLKVTEDETGLRPVANTPTLFGNMVPVPIPKE
ncbi:MAG TPA: hypothetical protein VM529_25295, partial [Gemmata sp.]|nr:hypothetical protein [Gemmata sp.]